MDHCFSDFIIIKFVYDHQIKQHQLLMENRKPFSQFLKGFLFTKLKGYGWKFLSSFSSFACWFSRSIQNSFQDLMIRTNYNYRKFKNTVKLLNEEVKRSVTHGTRPTSKTLLRDLLKIILVASATLL